MADVTIIEPAANSEEAPIEVVSPVPPEQTEAIADAAIEVAQIEADRDVKIEEIRAETIEDTNETLREATSEENEEWRRNIETRLEQQETTNREILSTLQALREQQSPPNLPESPANPEAMPESLEAPEPAPKPKRPHHRLI